MNPLVSVIIPLYNKNNYIIRAIKSVIAQKYDNWELIIIDDRSTDGSYDTCQRYISSLKTSKNIVLKRMFRNCGCYVAMNSGITISKGKYFCILGADDYFLSDKLTHQVSILENNKSLYTVINNYVRIDTNGRYTNDFSRKFDSKGFPGECTALFRKKEIIDSVGYFDSVRYGADSFYIEFITKKFPKRILYSKKLSYVAVKINNRLTTKDTINNRRLYTKLYRTFITNNINSKLPFPMNTRYFDVPNDMLP